jgi:methionyl-tRNA synthetase
VTDSKKRLLVTAGLPYANGSIHLGHLLEYIQTDIWCRFHRLTGQECLYICGDDTHGTPIMISAKKRGITPEELVAEVQIEHERDFDAFNIQFDKYYTTHSPENKKIAQEIYTTLKDKGDISTRTIDQAYCETDTMFLPDRFIRGECPKCGAADQYGDSCEVCSATYAPTDLKNPKCSVCGSPPITKASEHHFFKLGNYADYLKETTSSRVQTEIANKLDEWFSSGLRDWDISRDAPYFGFEIPDAPGKFFYVWMDAPMGYAAATQSYCDEHNLNFDDYWKSDQTEIHHFIGKDIVYFHTLFWPAMLHGAGYNTPKQVHVHGFLTVNGKKMSKSRGTFIQAATYLKHLTPEYLRFYYACKLNNSVSDVNLNLEDMVDRVNSDLLGKVVNLSSRVGTKISKAFDYTLGTVDENTVDMLAEIEGAAPQIAAYYQNLEYTKVTKAISALADTVNKYVQDIEPWRSVKTDLEACRSQVTTILNAARMLTIYLKPIVPGYAAGFEKFMGIEPLNWDDVSTRLENHTFNPYEHLLERVDPKKVAAMVEESKESMPAENAESASQAAESGPWTEDPAAPECTYDDFMKVDLRVAKIEKAEHVEGAKKLLKLTLDLGGPSKQVFAGIKSAYTPESLEGKLVVCVANLAPRKMKFGMSEAMVIAAGPGGKDIWLLSPDAGATPGQRVQ